ncbi:MAG TPA: 1-phosphofructokinase family hexose kinase [Desulfobulbaceae bacterium]|nr:1-phosphofructokinase family hexose kinase [Desulfobulbaceae bacterium]
MNSNKQTIPQHNAAVQHSRDADISPVALLTLNPAVDVTYTVPRLIADQKAHAVATRFDPGGNGINVGRALQRLEVSADSYIVTAGETGHMLERLLVHHLDATHYERVEGETRINGTIMEQESGSQYEVSGIGPSIPPSQLATLLNSFVTRAGKGIGVLTGSMPADISTELYAELVQRIQDAGGLAVVDSHHESLRRAILTGPFLIKPNRHELETLVGHELPTVELVAEQARLIARQCVQHVCVSLGGEGALLTGPDDTLYAAAPKVRVQSTVGAGDSMVAGLIAGFVRKLPLPDILRLAVACGAGTVQQPGTELFMADTVEALAPTIEIRELGI